MPELIKPTTRLHAAWLEAHGDWGPHAYQDGSGLSDTDDVTSTEGFAAWVERLRRAEDVSIPPPPDFVHCAYRWIVEDDHVLGAISLRLELNDFLLRAGGHIGYGIRPSARRRGLAVWALTEMLGEARHRGMDRVLLSCSVENDGSRRTIERCGGVLEDVRTSELGLIRRYWITL